MHYETDLKHEVGALCWFILSAELCTRDNSTLLPAQSPVCGTEYHVLPADWSSPPLWRRDMWINVREPQKPTASAAAAQTLSSSLPWQRHGNQLPGSAGCPNAFRWLLYCISYVIMNTFIFYVTLYIFTYSSNVIDKNKKLTLFYFFLSFLVFPRVARGGERRRL